MSHYLKLLVFLCWFCATICNGNTCDDACYPSFLTCYSYAKDNLWCFSNVYSPCYDKCAANGGIHRVDLGTPGGCQNIPKQVVPPSQVESKVGSYLVHGYEVGTFNLSGKSGLACYWEAGLPVNSQLEYKGWLPDLGIFYSGAGGGAYVYQEVAESPGDFTYLWIFSDNQQSVYRCPMGASVGADVGLFSFGAADITTLQKECLPARLGRN